MQIDNTSVDST